MREGTGMGASAPSAMVGHARNASGHAALTRLGTHAQSTQLSCAQGVCEDAVLRFSVLENKELFVM